MASLSCVCYRTMYKESKEQERCGLYSSDTNLYFEQPRSIFWGCSTKRGPSFLGIWEYNNIHNVEFSSYLLFNLSVSRFFLVCLPKSLLISCLNLVFPYISSSSAVTVGWIDQVALSNFTVKRNLSRVLIKQPNKDESNLYVKLSLSELNSH